ncbi:MAG: hypothetical protein HYZ00_13630, partial [Candidatus Hydrogenedentes bacterium]|nr:hypothetical protein [Candidatus Hydrogenedentota bacterium]
MRRAAVVVGSILLSLVFSAALPAQALELLGVEPPAAAEGETVVLRGADFDTAATYAISIGSLPATVTGVTVSTVTFVVPAGAQTGRVTLSDGVNAFEYGLSLTVLRPISVQHDPALPFSTAGYIAGTFYGDGNPLENVQTVRVPTLGATIVASAKGEESQALFAVSTGAESSLTLGAESTALALLFMLSGIHTADPAEAAARLEALAALPETQYLISQINVHYAANRDILESEYIDEALAEAYFAFINSVGKLTPAGESEKEYRQDFVNETLDFRSGYPRDLESPGYEGLRLTKNEKVSPAVPDSRGTPKLGIRYKAAKEGIGGVPNNPLDWISTIYELDPRDVRLDTRTEVDALVGSNTDAYPRLRAASFDRLYIKAKPATKVIDILGFAADLLTSAVPIFDDPRAQKQLSVPADHNAIYMVRNFSGAFFSPQRSLIINLPGGRTEDLNALTLNIVLSSFEMLEAVIRIGDFLGEDAMAKLILGASKAVGSAVAREAARGPISYQSILIIGDELNKYLAKELLSKKLIKDLGLQAVLRLPKALIKNFDIFAKFEKGSTALLRLAALTNASRLISSSAYMAAAVEDTIVVVGDPWAPRILSFDPVRGHRGTRLRLLGERFSTTPAENIVTFGRLGTGAPPPAIANVVEATAHSLLVEVPEEAATGPISVKVEARGETTTSVLAPPFQNFEVIPDPQITAVETGRGLVLLGQNFAVNPQDNEILFDGEPAGAGRDIGYNDTAKIYIISHGLIPGEHTVAVRIHGRSSNVFDFTVPEAPDASDGGQILITVLSDGNTPDGEITLREAMLIAAGTLGRALTRPPSDEPRPPGARYETDWVDEGVGGATADIISEEGTLDQNAGDYVLAQPLPPVPNFDTVQLFDRHVMGTGLASDG